MLYLIASNPAILEKFENAANYGFDFNLYDFYDISTYSWLSSGPELEYKSLKAYCKKDDVYVLMVERGSFPTGSRGEMKKFNSSQVWRIFSETGSIIETLTGSQDIKYYECNVSLYAKTTEADYGCRDIKEYEKRIFDYENDKKRDYERYSSGEGEPRLIKEYIKQEITVDCDGKYVDFNVPKSVKVTQKTQEEDGRSASWTGVEGVFKILVI